MSRAPSFIGTLAWAARHVTLDGVPFVPDDYPWLTEIAATVDRERNAKFLLLFPPQVFKTLFLQLRLLRTVCVEPVRSLWYCKTGEEANALSDEKLFPLMEATPAVMARFPKEEDRRGGKRIFRFVDSPVSLLSADVLAHRNGRTACDLYLDEAWQYDPGTIDEILHRADSFGWQRRTLFTLTGPTEGDACDQLWRASPRREWRVVCLHCRERVPLEFGEAEGNGGLRWDSDEFTRDHTGHWLVGVAKGTTRWVCPACEAPTRYSAGALRQLNDPARGAGYVTTNPGGDPQIHAWHAEAACFRPWEELVGNWLNACNSRHLGDYVPTENFDRKVRVRAWSPTRHLKAAKPLTEGDYQLGDPWPDEGLDAEDGTPLRVMAVDVQQDHYWVVIRQFSNRPGTYGHSRLLHFERGISEGHLEDIRARFNVRAGNVVVDSNYAPERVRQMCAVRHWIAVNGIGETATAQRSILWRDGLRRIYSELSVIDAFMGGQSRSAPVCLQYNFVSRAAKDSLKSITDAHDALGRPLHTAARNTGAEYRKQRAGEVLRIKRHPRNPEEWVSEWHKVGPNHAFDCEVMANIHARLLGYYGQDRGETEKPGP